MLQHKTVTIVVEKGGKFLLIKRANRPMRGFWAPPGGHVDKGERVYAAAQREALEEVGDVEVEKKPLFSFVHDIRLGHRHHAHVFRGKPVGKIRAASDAAKIGWFTLAQIASLNVTHYTNIIFNRLFPKISYDDFSHHGHEKHRRH